MSEQGEGAAGNEKAPVPFDKFNAERVKAQEYRTKYEALSAEATQLREQAAQAQALQKQVEELGGYKARAAELEESLGMARFGLVDDEAQAVARALHKLKAADKPITEWLGGLTGEGAEVPAGLSPWLRGGVQVPAATQQAATGAPAPRQAAGEAQGRQSAAPPLDGSKITPQQYVAAKAAGNLAVVEAYDRHYRQVMQERLRR